jgi:hypothetical protein
MAPPGWGSARAAFFGGGNGHDARELTTMMSWADHELVSISALQHYAYCKR